jgi:hypothetical protein
MKEKNISLSISFLLIFLILFTATSAKADSSKDIKKSIFIDFRVIPYGLVEYEHNRYQTPSREYRLVGDSFYYNLTLKSDKNITDILDIYVISPDNKTLDFRSQEINVNNKESYFAPQSSKGGDTLAMPFNLPGDYEIKVCSKNSATFYREYRVWFDGYSPSPSYVWYDGCISYYFDVMPQWQYQVVMEQRKTNSENAQLNRDITNVAFYTMIIAIIALLIQIIQLMSTNEGRSSLSKAIASIPSILLLLLGAYLIGSSLELNPTHWGLFWVGAVFGLIGLVYLIKIWKSKG